MGDYCYDCDRQFVSQSALESHWLNSNRHSWCQRCERHFDSDTARAAHEDASYRHWICHPCGLDFLEQVYLDEHRLTHSAHNWCEECERDFDSPSNLRSHSLTHQPRDIHCFGCSRSFSTHSGMLIHLESGNCITSPEEMDHYAQKCYQSAKYVTPGCEHYLRARMRPEQRAHGAFNPERGNYRCEECSKAFWSNAGMMRHIQSPVHDHQAYRCPGCGVTATALSGLLQHVESESCHETIHHGSGSLGKMLHFLHVVLDKKR